MWSWNSVTGNHPQPTYSPAAGRHDNPSSIAIVIAERYIESPLASAEHTQAASEQNGIGAQCRELWKVWSGVLRDRFDFGRRINDSIGDTSKVCIQRLLIQEENKV